MASTKNQTKKPTTKKAGAVSPEEQQAVIKAMYDLTNRELFNGELPEVFITFRAGLKKGQHHAAGYFSRGAFASTKGGKRAVEQHELAINPEIFGKSLDHQLDVIDTIVHEQVHLWLSQEPRNIVPKHNHHCKKFAAKCAEVGLQAIDLERSIFKPNLMGGGIFNPKAFEGTVTVTKLVKRGRKKVAEPVEVDCKLTQVGRKTTTKIVKDGPLHTLATAEIKAGRFPLDWRAKQQPKTYHGQRNKVTYVCDCQHKTWGKPGLSDQICGTCWTYRRELDPDTKLPVGNRRKVKLPTAS